MPWFYNSVSGELGLHTGIDALAYETAIHTGTGWHQLKIPDSATFAQAAAEALKEVPGGKAPTGSLATGVSNTVTAGASAIGTDLLKGFNWGNVLLRVAEAGLGIVLVAVGVAKVTGASNVISQAVKAKIP